MARTKPHTYPRISLSNISSGETVHQRALILIGETSAHLHHGSWDISKDSHVSVLIRDASETSIFPTQVWPVSEGHFKALVILNPGENLLQTPPLHLAILIAKDSPLLIDDPTIRSCSNSSDHCNLDAAISKFRMTAYMWQALTAEDMREKSLGRRSFRLEEEWATETLTRKSLQQAEVAADYMCSTARIHLIRSEYTVAQLRDLEGNKPNDQGKLRGNLHELFIAALNNYGGPFVSSAPVVVAGLILDSTFDAASKYILGHAALGSSVPGGISLGVFGSHLTYTWPSCIEEVPGCLLAITDPGDNIGNDDDGEGDEPGTRLGTMWEACSISQGKFLHEVGHAFGARHSSGIMKRGYVTDWPRCFLSRTAYCAADSSDGILVNPETGNDAKWELGDALAFKLLPHFSLPGDAIVSQEYRTAPPNISGEYKEGSAEPFRLLISCPSQLVRVRFNDATEKEPNINQPYLKMSLTWESLEARFGCTKPLKLVVLGMNGRSTEVQNVWRLLNDAGVVRAPSCSVLLRKKSVKSERLEEMQSLGGDMQDTWNWAVLLKKRSRDGKLKRATTIDVRIGFLLDGAIIHFEDGQKTPCGPRWRKDGRRHRYGGHLSDKFNIPVGIEITKVEVGRSVELDGVRFYMSDGSVGGYVCDDPKLAPKHVLEPSENEKIIGFYGRTNWTNLMVEEFGIITVLRDAELLDTVYDLEELGNIDGGTGPRVIYQHGENHQEDEENEKEGDDDDDDDWVEG